MRTDPLSIRQLYQAVRGATIIAVGMRIDAGAIVELLPLDASDREYALEILRQRWIDCSYICQKMCVIRGELGQPRGLHKSRHISWLFCLTPWGPK